VAGTVKQLEQDYGDNLKVVFIHNALPFHQNAKPAALASMAANRQGKFWEMHDKLFANAQALTSENYEKWAGEIGLDIEKFKKDLADPELAKKIDRDQAAANALGARGTPAFFINGVNLSGAQPIEKFKEAIDAQLKAAEEELGKGTKLEALEDKLTLANNAQNGANLLKWLKKGEEPPAQPKQEEKKARPQEDDKTVYKAEFRKDDPSKGPATALVTIVEVSEFQ